MTERDEEMDKVLEQLLTIGWELVETGAAREGEARAILREYAAQVRREALEEAAETVTGHLHIHKAAAELRAESARGKGE